MIDLLVLIFLLAIFGSSGLLFFILYVVIKKNWPHIADYIKKYKFKNVIDVEELMVDKIKKSKTSNQFNSLFQSLTSFHMEIPSLKRILQIAGILFVLFMLFDGFTSIPAGHVGVVYDRGRGVLPMAFDEGLHLKIPFWQVVEKMDARLQAYTMSIDPDEGTTYRDDSIESLTRDGQKVFADVTIQFRILGENAPWLFQQVGIDYITKVIRPGARNIIRDVLTGYDSTKLFTQETRLEAQEQMRKLLRELYANNKVNLETVLLRNILFSEVYLQAIEDKQVAQQRIQKAEYEKQEAEQLKQKKIIEAEAEAQAIKLKGETLRANPQVIQFEFVQKMADNISWGILPNDILPLVDLQRFNQ